MSFGCVRVCVRVCGGGVIPKSAMWIVTLKSIQAQFGSWAITRTKRQLTLGRASLRHLGPPQHGRVAGFSAHHSNNLFPLKTCMVGFPEARDGQAQ